MVQTAFDTDLSTWLRIKMAERNINTVGLATAIDVSNVAVGYWTRGERMPNYGNCIKLARFFNVPEERMLIMAGHRKPKILGQLRELRESAAGYNPDARARLIALLDELTDDQIEILTDFLESIK